MNEYPAWFKVLNLESNLFEKSKYASLTERERFRLKDINILRKIFPNMYQSASEEVKEHQEYNDLNGERVKIGKYLGSISVVDAGLHPELNYDPKAQDKYWQDHPELKRK